MMSLPGYAWLRSKLAAMETISGGWEAKMHHPVVAGAGFAMSATLVLAWLLALVPLCLWAGGRAAAAEMAYRGHGEGRMSDRAANRIGSASPQEHRAFFD